MKDNIILGIIQNFAILLTFSILYDHFYGDLPQKRSIRRELLSGIVLSMIVILVILTPWDYEDGIFFDTRSVLLSVSGLFFGFIPTLCAVISSIILRMYIGGVGMWMGIGVIVSASLAGLLYMKLLPGWKTKRPLLHLYGLGLITHVLMLSCIFLLPHNLQYKTFTTVFFPVIILYPLTTLFCGWYILHQMRLRRDRDALHDSEKRWKFALEGTGDGVWDWNMRTDEIYFSPQWKSMLGYSHDEVGSHLKEWEKLVHPDDIAMANEEINKHKRGETAIYAAEYRMYCKDGSICWILDTGKIIEYDADGQPVRFLGTHKDISYRKEKEMQLQYERFLLESLMNFVPEPIFFKDLDSRFIRVNQALVNQFGCKNADELIGKTDFDFLAKEAAQQRFDAEQQIIATGTPYNREESYVKEDGTRYWGISNKLPLRNVEGAIIGTFGITVDITRLKKTEQALKENERYTNSILASIPDLMFVINSDFVFLDFKSGDIKDLNVPVDNFLNKKITDVFSHQLSVLFQEAINRSLHERTNVQIEYELPKDGRNTYFECYVVPLGAEKVLVKIRNITSHKIIEQELQHSQNELKHYAAHLQNVREEERLLLAREIHDELGQMLIALKIDVGMFKIETNRLLRDHQVLDAKFDSIMELLDGTIKTTRKIMTGLRPATLELVGIYDAVRQYVNEFSNRYHFDVDLVMSEDLPFFDDQKSIALFRIIQEALTNVIKHARATKIRIEIRSINGNLLLEIRDNGCGLNLGTTVRNDAYGLLGMRERVFLLNGKLEFLPNPDGGTLIQVSVPATA